MDGRLASSSTKPNLTQTNLLPYPVSLLATYHQCPQGVPASNTSASILIDFKDFLITKVN